jgi:bacterioferritin-associated ferredoxin
VLHLDGRTVKPDDEICYCYHVSLRKLVNFARRKRLARPSQMSECLGAGTGCGWCIPILQRIHEAARRAEEEGLPQADESGAEPAPPESALPDLPVSPEEYARMRDDYRRDESRRHRW